MQSRHARGLLATVAFTAMLLGSGIGTSGAALAQSTTEESISADDYLAYLDLLARESRLQGKPQVRKGSPATVGVPSGFALPHGAGFAAGALSSSRREFAGTSGEDAVDASGAFGLGFGDADATLGLEVVLGISSVSPDDFGDSGSIGFKLSRNLPSVFSGQSAALSLGVGSAFRWGDAEDSDPNYYLAYTSTFSLPAGDTALPGVVSAGYGSGLGTSDDEEGVFLGAGLAVNRWLSAGVSWSANEYIAGLTASTKWQQDFDVQLGLSYGDITHRNSDGRVMLSLAIVKMDLF